mgnify:CR=1 FL=1
MRTLGNSPLKLLLAMCFSVAFLLPASVYADFQEGWAAYENGDYATALAEWEPLAEQGYANAQSILGIMYNDGKGVLQDYAYAHMWHRLAAEQGYSPAQINLGFMYELGEGVLQDYAYAHMWYNIAAANGNADAGEFRQIVADLMTPSQIEQAQEMARNCLNSGYVDCGE